MSLTFVSDTQCLSCKHHDELDPDHAGNKS